MDSGFGRWGKIIMYINIYRGIVILSTYSISDGKNKYQTLYDPRFLTEHPSFTLRPAGTVTFTIGSVNSGSPIITETTKYFIYLSRIFPRNEYNNRDARLNSTWIFFFSNKPPCIYYYVYSLCGTTQMHSTTIRVIIDDTIQS